MLGRDSVLKDGDKRERFDETSGEYIVSVLLLLLRKNWCQNDLKFLLKTLALSKIQTLRVTLSHMPARTHAFN